MTINKDAIFMSVGLAGLLLVGIILIRSGNEPISPEQITDNGTLIRTDSHMTGKKDAKVNLVEFGDYQCPGCAVAHSVVKQVLDEYKDNMDVNFVFRHFPLSSIHANAQIAATVAESAGKQGKFWEMHSQLYENQTDWAESLDAMNIFVKHAQNLNLDIPKFKADLGSDTIKATIREDVSDAEALGINSTPTFFLNGVKSVGVYKYDQLKNAIEDELKKTVQ